MKFEAAPTPSGQWILIPSLLITLDTEDRFLEIAFGFLNGAIFLTFKF